MYDDIVSRYDGYLLDMGVSGMFDITPELSLDVYFNFVYPQCKTQYLDISLKRFKKLVMTQLNYTRLSLLRVKMFRNNNSASGIKEGYVYCISNPAFPEHVKIGSSIDVKRRLASYQTYTPFRDFVLDAYYFSQDRFADEKLFHSKYEFVNEWYKCPNKPYLIEMMQHKKDANTQIVHSIIERKYMDKINSI